MGLKKRLALQLVRTKFKVLATLSHQKAAEAAFTLFCTPQLRSQKPHTKLFQSAEHLSFSFEGETIKGFCWNSKGTKKILILHGFESTALNFEGFISPLIQHGFCVLAFDAVAHGYSTGRQTTVVQYKALIKNIVGRYGPVQYFLAHSLGGLAVSLYLETVKTKPEGLVLIAPATETETAINQYFAVVQLPDATKKAFSNLIQEKSGHPVSWFSVKRAVRKLDVPILWCHDKEDKMTPLSDVTPLMQQKPAHIEFFITEGLGHRRIYRSKEVQQKVISFLTSRYPTHA